MIETIWDRYHEPLSLEDMADTAIYSRFHFSRVFRSVTGTSPGRFLTAVRLYKAKNLLLQSSASVTEVSYQVGYNSPGTFSSRFTKSVGMSPARFRYFSRVGMSAPIRRPFRAAQPGIVEGRLRMPNTPVPVRTYVGAFDSNIPQGVPASYRIIDEGNSYRLDGLPDGEWFIYAVMVAVQNLDPRPWARRPLYVSSAKRVQVVDGGPAQADLLLRPSRLTDLPILVALPELDSRRLPGLALVRDRVS
ncbi:MAG: helix-turn-helix transcriptional regulator [Jatrophihabitans sp.]